VARGEGHEVEAADTVGRAALVSIAGFAVEPVDQADDIEEAAAGTAEDA
jgi:hypothetical protein